MDTQHSDIRQLRKAQKEMISGSLAISLGVIVIVVMEVLVILKGSRDGGFPAMQLKMFSTWHFIVFGLTPLFAGWFLFTFGFFSKRKILRARKHLS